MNVPWRTRAIVFAATVVLLVGSLAVAGMGPRWVLIIALVAVIGAVVCLVLDVGDSAASTEWPRAEEATRRSNGADWRVGTLRMLLINERRTDGASSRLYEVLVGLIDDRLLTEHRIERTTDPAGARAVLGADLFAFAGSPAEARRLAKPQEVARLVTLIEQI